MAEKSLVKDAAVTFTAAVPPDVVAVVDSSSESLPHAASTITVTAIPSARVAGRRIRLSRKFTTTPF